MKVKNKLAVVTILMMIALVIIAAVSNFNEEPSVVGEHEVTHYAVKEVEIND